MEIQGLMVTIGIQLIKLVCWISFIVVCAVGGLVGGILNLVDLFRGK